jgi:general secretion pathway protein G
MHATRPPSRCAFTLIEIGIVVVIVGILAALVLPQFIHAGDIARRNSLITQLQTLRTQIASYKTQHNQALPDLHAGWGNLTGTTSGAGNKTVGPYLDAPQINPLNGLSTIYIGPGAALEAPCGWVYDYQADANTGSGHIWATGPTGLRYFNEADPAAADLDTAPAP